MKLTKHTILRNLKILLFCVLLIILGLGAVHGSFAWLQTKDPLVDFSDRSQTRHTGDAMEDQDNCLRFAVATMVCVEATFSTYKHLIDRVCQDVGREETFVLRPSYAEVRQALEQGKVDVAFVCTGTYVHALEGQRIKLLVQPEFVDGLQYQSVLIVPASSSAQSLEDLRSKVIAFTDPESNTGCLVPSALLAEKGFNPKTYFKKVIYTRSHDRSIMATALGTVDAAFVDSLILESKIRQAPSFGHRVKVIQQSASFGPPPIVVPKTLDKNLEDALRKAFLGLDQDNEGRAILASIGIKRFIPARPEDYQSAIALYRTLQAKTGDQ